MGKIAKIAGVCALVLAGMVGWAIYQGTLPPPEFANYKGVAGVSSNDVLNVKMERMAEQAAMDAWSRCHIRVHIGVHSLPDFEHYLDLISKSPDFQKASPKDKWGEAIIAGAFVGEAIRRTHGGFWQEKSDLPGVEPFVLNVEGSENWPVNWCLKRLVNGPEDNIYDKYVLFILKRTNEFSGDMTYWSNTGTKFEEITNITIK
jgi:hypothetical protein